MLPKIVSVTPSSSNANMAKVLEQDSQIVTMGQLREVIKQMNQGQEAFNNKLKSIRTNTVKLPAVKRFDGTQIKLKGYLI